MMSRLVESVRNDVFKKVEGQKGKSGPAQPSNRQAYSEKIALLKSELLTREHHPINQLPPSFQLWKGRRNTSNLIQR